MAQSKRSSKGKNPLKASHIHMYIISFQAVQQSGMWNQVLGTSIPLSLYECAQLEYEGLQ